VDLDLCIGWWAGYSEESSEKHILQFKRKNKKAVGMIADGFHALRFMRNYAA